MFSNLLHLEWHTGKVQRRRLGGHMCLLNILTWQKARGTVNGRGKIVF